MFFLTVLYGFWNAKSWKNTIVLFQWHNFPVIPVIFPPYRKHGELDMPKSHHINKTDFRLLNLKDEKKWVKENGCQTKSLFLLICYWIQCNKISFISSIICLIFFRNIEKLMNKKEVIFLLFRFYCKLLVFKLWNSANNWDWLIHF